MMRAIGEGTDRRITEKSCLTPFCLRRSCCLPGRCGSRARIPFCHPILPFCLMGDPHYPTKNCAHPMGWAHSITLARLSRNRCQIYTPVWAAVQPPPSVKVHVMLLSATVPVSVTVHLPSWPTADPSRVKVIVEVGGVPVGEVPATVSAAA